MKRDDYIILAGLIILIFFGAQLFVLTSANWVRVIVKDPNSEPLENVECRITWMQDYTGELPMIARTDSSGTITFKGVLDNGAFPTGRSFEGYCHCGGEVKEFSGTTNAYDNIVIKRTTCDCANMYSCGENGDPVVLKSCSDLGYYSEPRDGYICTIYHVAESYEDTCYKCTKTVTTTKATTTTTHVPGSTTTTTLDDGQEIEKGVELWRIVAATIVALAAILGIRRYILK